uniref:Uncharacterized protein n=1 Tax=Panagrolaimus davidi TaxID=227884 RepID=A0A914QD13_9BILA
MDNRNDEGSNEEHNFRRNSGCFNPDEQRFCNKPGPDSDEGNFDQRESEGSERRFRDDREGRFEGEERGGYERSEFDRDDNNRGDEERERRHQRDE